MHVMSAGVGWIELVCGPMFSGKTEELIRRLRRSLYARKKVAIFKPVVDTRYSNLEIVSHSEQRLEALPVENAQGILDRVDDDTDVVGIDEAQFFSPDLVRVVDALADQGRRVIIAGLDQDYRAQPFGPMPLLMIAAEFVTKTLAICVVCGNPAGRSQRLARDTQQVMLGAAEHYEPRCRRCHQPGSFSLYDQAEAMSEIDSLPITSWRNASATS